MRTLLHSCGRWQFVSSWCQLCGSHYQEDAAKSTLSHLHFVFAHIETWLRTVGFPPVCERAKTEMCWLKTRADKLFLRYRRNRKFPSQVLCAFANMVFPGQSAWPMKCFFFFFSQCGPSAKDPSSKCLNWRHSTVCGLQLNSSHILISPLLSLLSALLGVWAEY